MSLTIEEAGERIEAAIVSRRAFSFVRVGDGEALIGGADPAQFSDEHGISEHLEKMIPEGLRRADLVGVQEREDGLFGLVRKMFDAETWPAPAEKTTADLWYRMDPHDVCRVLHLGDEAHPWVLVTSHGEELVEHYLEALGIKLVIRSPRTQASRFYSQLAASLRTALFSGDLSGVLLACGPVKLLLAPFIAQEFDVPVIDIGAIVDSWTGEDSRTISIEGGLSEKWKRFLDLRVATRAEVGTGKVELVR